MKDKPTFRIVENDNEPPKVEDMDQLILDYLNPKISLDQILIKHKLSRNEYQKLKPSIVEVTRIPRKPSYHGGKPPIKDVSRYISQDSLSQKWRVAKYIKGMLRHFGRYDTFEEAERVRDVMADNDWDWEYYWENIRPHCFTEFPTNSREDIIDDFEKDYLDGMTGEKLRKKYGVSPYYYNNLSISIKHKYGLSRKPTKVKA